ncbi:Lar family restriction alleviation protein [Ottowia sp.]|jgi:hypothetical protein|uniref:Lar family restriction alleviation protein n=1 Tax=Ottowia sp. TaxID=1898956 RepID=UPI002C4652A3|nr:Lar family restriction alleviation protein [Ottowia sp.]HRN74603.1 hypothetical protein [Ottowia sp.]HRQ01434.1 hypothetical protein [Ottowia sp.]
MKKSLSLRCPQCGGNEFVDTEHVNPSDTVICSACNASMLLSDLSQTRAAQEAERRAIEASRAAYGKLVKK